MSFNYYTETKDLRAAMYYGVLMRNALLGRILLVLLPLTLLYYFGVTCGLWPDIPIVSYVVLAFVVWVLILLGNTERQIMKYSRSADSLLGIRIEVKIQDNWLFVNIADRDFHFKGEISDLAGAVELKSIFLLYVNAQQAFLIPKRALQDEAQFMKCLAHISDDRFIRESDGNPGKGIRGGFLKKRSR